MLPIDRGNTFELFLPERRIVGCFWFASARIAS
jgi:hypothetical protein